MNKSLLNIRTHLQQRTLQQVVENRTAYTLDHTELCIYETREKAFEVGLRFDIPMLASMITGKKIMHIEEKPAFEFLPGQSVVLTPKKTCYIDFPEATDTTPTECLTLAIAPEKITAFCERLNEKCTLPDAQQQWSYNATGSQFVNDIMINQLLNRLILICTENNTAKDFFANLVLQELVVRLMQSNQKNTLLDNHKIYKTNNRFAHVVEYIQQHLQDNITVKTLSRQAYMSEPHFFRCFKQQFGMSPVEFINEQRIKAARMMLRAADISISEISFACGFNNLNYFLRMFKRHTGLTPAQYRKSMLI
ncbi:AraC family transcriptional regulator [Panacibacter sp. DH6]|uniref:AraC family transcriptional regulator n=1 Tax=Panacibacter microcysteis TaxID=2793269 RepID=A0A931DXR5_9BACT|nr:helix-turn-helix domain-containing protein [Panacibacter microcysteis]MBG9374842.1 AraC family transcriptional regulator [Panacibacter microcysteis]